MANDPTLTCVVLIEVAAGLTTGIYLSIYLSIDLPIYIYLSMSLAHRYIDVWPTTQRSPVSSSPRWPRV